MKRSRRNDGRLRVSGGYAGLALLTIAAMLIVAPYLRGDDAPPKKLLVANTATWRTTGLTEAPSDAPLHHDYSQCASGPSGAVVNLDVGGAMFIRDIGSVTCVDGFKMIDAPSTGKAVTFVYFNDGASTSSFEIPPLGALYNNDPAVISKPMVSDDEEGIWVTVLPAFPDTPFYVTLQDSRSATFLPIVEKFKASPPIAQVRIAARGSYRLSVSLGTDPLFRCFGAPSCAVYAPVYGFVSNGAESGASVRVSVFGESQP